MESVEIPFPIEAPYFKILWGLRPLTPATSRLQCCFFLYGHQNAVFFLFVARLIFSQSQIYPLLNILISNNRSYMSSQIQTGHCKYMSREKMAFLVDLRSIWIFNPNIFSSQSSRKVNGLNGLNEIHGMNFDFYHRLTLSSVQTATTLLAKNSHQCLELLRPYVCTEPNPFKTATVVYDPYGTMHMHTVLPGPIWLSLEVNKLVSNNFSKDRSFQRYIVLDVLANPD